MRDRPFGSYVIRGYALYFYSFEDAEYARAVEECLYRKLELLAIDTPEDIDDWYFGDIPPEEDQDENTWWTSAAPCSKSDPLNKTTNSCSSVTWCANNVETRLNYTLNFGQFTRPYCIIYRAKTQQLAPKECSFQSLFVCEPACARPKCPSQKECQKDESLFEKIDGKTYLKKEHEILGTWEQTDFGEFYFLGKKLVNWQENWKTCCSLGLKPLAVNGLLTYLDRPNSPMQGVVFWSAMTRAGCPLRFENCFHNVSEWLEFDIAGVKKGGSCVAVSVRDPNAKKVMDTGLAMKTTVCTSKLLLGCQGTEQTFEIRDDTSNCELPKCAGLPDCVMSDEYFLKQHSQEVLLAPWRFGKWHSCCDNSILELHDEYGTWDEAYKRCCSLGMDLLSIQNPAKQDCLGNPYKNSNPNEKGYLPFRTEAWTAGRDIQSCHGQLRWCTGYLNDYLKNDLMWKNGHDPRFANNSCVYIDFGDPVVPSLALADCSNKKQIICEAPMGVDKKSKMHYHPCRRNFRVKDSEAEKIWNTGDLSRTSYAAKKMIQCIAEHIGLVYNSTKINENVYLDMMSRTLHVLDVPTMLKSIEDQRTLLSSFEGLYSEGKIHNLDSDIYRDGKDEYYSNHFDLAAELINKLYECKGIQKTNEETFAFDFLVCLLKSKGLDRFWKVYEFRFERGSVIPADYDLNSPCMTFDNFLNFEMDLCLPSDGSLPTTPSGPAVRLTLGLMKIKGFDRSSFTECLNRRGSLPYAKTKQEFDMMYNAIRNAAPTLTIIWSQGFYDTLNNKFMWCRSDVIAPRTWANIPIPVAVNVTTKQDFVMLVSLPGATPNLHAVPATEQLKYQTDVFCLVPDSAVKKCA
ncbi:uncharacterized protein LOC135946129 [Cloeon dipterum]|uniref:uncharacterized protein LOC135946129 n=1 Tax=Cloeon dipterum TaxID=197152 RepID=UPI00321FEE49